MCLQNITNNKVYTTVFTAPPPGVLGADPILTSSCGSSAISNIELDICLCLQTSLYYVVCMYV
jgi:hypothetical protein